MKDSTKDVATGTFHEVKGAIKSQAGKVELPSYKADVTSTFSNFKLNVSIPDTVFGG